MDTDTERHHLEKAEADIAEAHDRIEKQRAIISKLKEDGHDSKTAEKLLEAMLQSAAAMEAHRIVILESLGLYKPGESNAAPENRPEQKIEE
jgi:multidrug resistance efflux pump